MATILVVDDEPDIRLLTKLNLERDGHQIVTAGNGAEALAAVQEALPDLIVLDVMMPEVDGWAVLDQLKAHLGKPISEVPVILLTALGSPLDRVKGGIEGAVRYLTKPIDLDDLRAAVTDALTEPRIGAAPQGPGQGARDAGADREQRLAHRSGRLAAAPAQRARAGARATAPAMPTPGQLAAANLDHLTTKQRELLDAVRRARR